MPPAALLEFKISATGAQKTAAELAAIQGALQNSAKSAGNAADSYIAAANSLNITTKQAIALGQNLGLSAQQTQRFGSLLEGLNRSGANSATKFAVLNKELGISRQQFDALPVSIRNSEQALQGATVAASATTIALAALIANASKTAIEFERLETQINFATGGIEQGAEAMRFINQEVDRLNLPLQTSVSGFAKLASTTKGTALEGKATEEIFSSLAQAARVLNLSQDDTNGALTAFTQIISKGKVQAEELRGQLGERIPGAFQIFARALGVTTQELDKLLQAGEVGLPEFQKFVQQLAKETESGLAPALKTTGASADELGTALTRFNAEIGERTLPAVGALANAASDLLNGFLGLPAPVQNLVIGVGALAGALTAAVGVLGIYKTLQIQATLAAGAETLALIAQTIATKGAAAVKLLFTTQITANTLALQANAIALQAGTVATGGFAVATGTLTGALATLQAALLPVLASLAGLAALLAGTSFITYTAKLGEANRNLESLSNITNTLSNESLNYATKLKALNSKQGELTETEKKRRDGLIELAKATIVANNAQIQALKDQATLDPSQAGNVQTQIADLEQKNALLQRQIEAATNAAEAGKKTATTEKQSAEERAKAAQEAAKKIEEANKKIVDSFDKATQRAQTLSELEQAQAEQAVRASLLNAGGNREQAEEQAEERLLEIRRAGAERRVALAQQTATKIDQLEAQGILSAEDAAQRRLQIQQELSAAASEILEADLAKQELALQRQIRAFERANREAEAAIRRSQTERSSAARSKLLSTDDRAATEEAVQAEILKIQEDALEAQLALAQQQRQQIDELEQSGALKASEAAQQRLELEQEIADFNSQRIDLELQRQRQLEAAANRRIQQELLASRTALDAQQRLNDAAAKGIQRQQELLRAQTALAQAQGNLAQQQAEERLQAADVAAEKQRLEERLQLLKLANLGEFAQEQARIEARLAELADPDAERNAAQERLRAEQELEQVKVANFVRAQQAKQQEIALAERLAAIELRREEIQARIAILEAEAAIKTAENAKASEAELANLREQLALKQQLLGELQAEAQAQQEISQIERQRQQIEAQAEAGRLGVRDPALQQQVRQAAIQPVSVQPAAGSDQLQQAQLKELQAISAELKSRQPQQNNTIAINATEQGMSPKQVVDLLKKGVPRV